MGRGPAVAGEAPHGHRARPARTRRQRQATGGLLAGRLRQWDARPAAAARHPDGHRRRALAGRRHRAAVRLPVPADVRTAHPRRERGVRRRGDAVAPRRRPSWCGTGHRRGGADTGPAAPADGRPRRRTPRSAGPSRRTRRGAHVGRTAGRVHPQCLPAHPAQRHRHSRSGGGQSRPALSRELHPDAARVGVARPGGARRPRPGRRAGATRLSSRGGAGGRPPAAPLRPERFTAAVRRFVSSSPAAAHDARAWRDLLAAGGGS